MEDLFIRLNLAIKWKKITIKALQPLVGASPSAMNGYATGKRLPPLDVAIKIAQELDVSLDWLCGLPYIPRKEEEEKYEVLNKMVDAYASFNALNKCLDTPLESKR